MKKDEKETDLAEGSRYNCPTFHISRGAFAYSMWNALTKTVESMHTPIDRNTDKRTKDLALSDQGALLDAHARCR